MMKQITTLLLLVFMFSANAQTEKEWVTGINLGYLYNKNSDSNYGLSNLYSTRINKKINIEVNIGRKLNENLALGFGVNYFFNKNEVTYLSNYKGKGISPLLFIDYIKSIENKLSIVVKGYVKYDFCRYDVARNAYGGYDPYSYMTNDKEYKYQYLNTGIKPAFRYNLNEKLGIELTIGKIEYRMKTRDIQYETKNDKANSFQINLKPKNWLVGIYFNI